MHLSKSRGHHDQLPNAIKMMLATPTVNGNHNRKGLSAKSGDGLATQAKLLSTPQARDYRTGQAERFDNPARSRNLNDQMAKLSSEELAENLHEVAKSIATQEMNAKPTGKLSVTFVAWMMGYPPDWLEIE